MVMKKLNSDYTAYCGLDCETCEARIATVNDDIELRVKVAKEWSELNRVEITPEMITGNNKEALERLKSMQVD